MENNFGIIECFCLIIAMFLGYRFLRFLYFNWKYNNLNRSLADDLGEIKKDREVLSFSFENVSDEKLTINLCELSKLDKRYNYGVNVDYYKLIEYLKFNAFCVFKTRIGYDNGNWQKDVIYSESYSPFSVSRKPILLGFHNFSPYQYMRNIIDSDVPYLFSYFDSIIFTINPKEKKSITLIIDDFDVSDGKMPKCALSIKNNSNEKKVVSLFDKEFLDNSIEIKNVYENINYSDILNQFDVEKISCSLIKMFVGNNNKQSILKVNFDEFNTAEFMDSFNFQDEILELDLKEETIIALFEIEIEPNTEMLISFS